MSHFTILEASVVKIKNSLYPKIKLTKGCPTLKLSLPCFPLTPFNGLALCCSFMVCLALSGFSCLGEKSPSLLLQPTLYLLAHGIEQKRLERVKLRAGAVLPQNSQRSMLPSSEINTNTFSYNVFSFFLRKVCAQHLKSKDVPIPNVMLCHDCHLGFLSHNQKLAYFVLYLKMMNTFLKNNVCIL